MNLDKRVLESSMMGKEEFLEHCECNKHIGKDNQNVVAEDVRRLCRDFSSGMILDIGCGIANMSIYLAQIFNNSFVVGIDAYDKAINYGKELVNIHGMSDKIELVKAYLPHDSLNYQYKNFDLIFSRSTLHHFANPLDFWSIVKDNLRENGSVFVLDLIRPPDIETVYKLAYNRFQGDFKRPIVKLFINSLCAAYRPQEVKEHLETVGLLSMKIITTNIHMIIYR